MDRLLLLLLHMHMYMGWGSCVVSPGSAHHQQRRCTCRPTAASLLHQCNLLNAARSLPKQMLPL